MGKKKGKKKNKFTTIQIDFDVKAELSALKKYWREPNNDVLRRILKLEVGR